MIHVNALRFRPTCTIVFVGLLATGLIASPAAPAFAQGSGTLTTTGSLNTARSAHTGHTSSEWSATGHRGRGHCP
jgi:hypothetical protein